MTSVCSQMCSALGSLTEGRPSQLELTGKGAHPPGKLPGEQTAWSLRGPARAECTQCRHPARRGFAPRLQPAPGGHSSKGGQGTSLSLGSPGLPGPLLSCLRRRLQELFPELRGMVRYKPLGLCPKTCFDNLGSDYRATPPLPVSPPAAKPGQVHGL